jgi:hypothetical protein
MATEAGSHGRQHFLRDTRLAPSNHADLHRSPPVAVRLGGLTRFTPTACHMMSRW